MIHFLAWRSCLHFAENQNPWFFKSQPLTDNQTFTFTNLYKNRMFPNLKRKNWVFLCFMYRGNIWLQSDWCENTIDLKEKLPSFTFKNALQLTSNCSKKSSFELLLIIFSEIHSTSQKMKYGSYLIFYVWKTKLYIELLSNWKGIKYEAGDFFLLLNFYNKKSLSFQYRCWPLIIREVWAIISSKCVWT